MTEDIEKDQETINKSEQSVNKLRKLRNILFMSAISVVWLVSAIFSLIDLNKGLGILETPWVLLGIFLTIAVIFIIILPLFRNLRTDVRKAIAEKEEKKQMDTEKDK